MPELDLLMANQPTHVPAIDGTDIGPKSPEQRRQHFARALVGEVRSGKSTIVPRVSRKKLSGSVAEQLSRGWMPVECWMPMVPPVIPFPCANRLRYVVVDHRTPLKQRGSS